MKLMLVMMMSLALFDNVVETSKPRLPCKILYGKCIPSGDFCQGTVVQNGCTGGTTHKCCTPRCPEGSDNDGTTFLHPLSGQCFRYMTTTGDWFQGVKSCADVGLTLAKPYMPVDLRSYMTTRFNTAQYFASECWLNAQGNGSVMVWGQGGAIPDYTPFKFILAGFPWTTTTDYCLLLLVGSLRLGEQPNHPYFTATCTGWVPKHPLCEYDL